MADPGRGGALERTLSFLRRVPTRLGVRLLAVNVVVVFVPIFGIEFARLFERRLLDALERDMEHQALIVGELVRSDLARGIGLDDTAHEETLVRIAREARARLRLLDAHGSTVADSHAHGPPEGYEAGAERDHLVEAESDASEWSSSDIRDVIATSRYAPSRWPDVPRRAEVRAALAGKRSAYARVRERAPAVLLFLARPVISDGRVVAVVYVTRSTTPVMQDLYRIRRSLSILLAIALSITVAVTLLLSLSITRPLARLAQRARRIANGEKDVPIERIGHGEVRELADAFATMTERLDERLVHSRDFAADVAHELKSPLTSIRGAAELLEEGAADDPVARARFLGNIRLDVERLDRIVSRLLELGRIEAAMDERTPVELDGLVRRIAERSATPEIAVEVTIESRPIVLVRKGDAEAALQNVIENAVRFSTSGDPVRVVVRLEREAPIVAITNRGPAISDADRARIFDRFFTTDAERNGTGLGLAIAKSAMVAHGGSIDVTSAPPPGATTFTLRFPRSVVVR